MNRRQARPYPSTCHIYHSRVTQPNVIVTYNDKYQQGTRKPNYEIKTHPEIITKTENIRLKEGPFKKKKLKSINQFEILFLKTKML